MSKSPDAFRTISEVADWLGVQAHVLRFWESKFSQVKPIKRAGGRRYYRPADMLLLGGIKKLLHGDGLTIKGAQKTLREHGINYVADMSQPLDDLTMAVIEGDVVEAAPTTQEPVVLPFEAPLPEPVDTASDVSSPPSEIMDTQEELDETQEPVEAAEEVAEAEPTVAAELAQPEETRDELYTEIEPVVEFEDAAPDRLMDAVPDDVDQAAPTDVEPVTEPEGIPELEAAPEMEVEPEAEAEAEAEDHLPGFLRNPLNDATESAPQEDTDGPTEDIAEPAFSVTPPTAPETEVSKPRVIDLPPLPVEQDMPASPSVLSALARLKSLDETQKQTVPAMLARLVELRSQMSNARKDARKD